MLIGSAFLMIAVGSILIAENLKNDVPKCNNDCQKTDNENESKASPVIHTQTENKSTLLREIYNTNFSESSHIHSSSTNPIYGNACPEGLTYVNIARNPFCYILTVKQRHPPKCPYENYMEDNTITEIYQQFQDQSIWVKAKRNTYNEFGEFEWLDISPRYLDTIKNYKILNGTISDKNCMIRINYTLFAVSCNEEYPVLCIYNYHPMTIQKYCTKRNNFIQCTSTSFNLDNKCYCQATTMGMQVSRDTFCEHFAEPDQFQNNILLTYLTNKSPCWFGIEQYNNEIIWTSSKDLVDYTYWTPNVNFSKPFGALDYSDPRGWLLTDDKSLQCAVCYIEVPYQNVTIHLRQIPNSNEIEIKIDNIFDIHNYYIFEYIVVCFTDYETTSIKKRFMSSIFELTPITNPVYMQTIEIKHYYPAYYWCESIQRPNLTKVYSNKILAYNNVGKHNHEYALTVETTVPIGDDPYLKEIHIKVTQWIYQELVVKADFINIVRPIKVLTFFEEIQTMELLLHVSTKPNSLSPQYEYNVLLTILQTFANESSTPITRILNFTRSESCLESETVSGNTTLHWSETVVGKTALPRELCLLSDSSPVTRKCVGDFLYGARWSKVNGDCTAQVFSSTTLELYSILNKEENPDKIAQRLSNITTNTNNVLVVDVHYISEILKRLENCTEINFTTIATIISNVMSYDVGVMNQAQFQLNSTDITLNALDLILSKAETSPNKDSLFIKSKKLLVQISNLTTSKITGVVLRKFNDSFGDSFESYEIMSLYDTTTVEDLLNENVEVAVLLSNNLLDEITACNRDVPNSLIISFFYNDILFNDPRQEKESDDNNYIVISVLLPSLKCVLKNSFTLVFKSTEQSPNVSCMHWKYGLNEMSENIRGYWKTDSIPTIEREEEVYVVCTYNHMTHFSVLVSNRNLRQEQTPEVNLALNIITLVGCSLSLIGLTGIFLMGIFYESWRRRRRNIIMLNFSVALAAQMILLFLSDIVKQNSTACTVIGVTLHYMILAGFGWMLIVAILQYRKFVLVFEQPINYLVIKCIVIGWCVPAIPVFICAFAFPEYYRLNSNGMCYPQNQDFYYAVFLPVLVFIVINLFVFVKILINVCSKKAEKYGGQESEIKLQVLLAILLFFLLGMSWIFGLGVTFTGSTILSFIFCATATLQGFVVFIFFVLLNKQSRLLRISIKKIITCAHTTTRT